MKAQYANIVFISGSEAEEPLNILNDNGINDAIKYLSQWDYGEYHQISKTPAKGTSDKYKQVGDYLITWNNGLGYIGLERIIQNPNGETNVNS